MATTQIRGAQILDLTVDTADLAANSVTEAKLNASVAGAGLAGGGGSALSVNVDASTIEINVDTLRVKAAGITETQLATSVAGNGLAGGGGTALSVNVDGSTIEISTDTLRVKDAGITTAKLAGGAVTIDKLSSFRPTDGGGLNLSVAAGKIRQDNAVASYAGGTVVLTDATTNYVEVDSAGSVTANTVGYTTGRWPIATVTTAAGAITLITDDRTWADIELGTASLTNSNFVDNETPSGDLDGVDVTYTLANTPSPAGSLHLYLNGIRQKSGAGNDYTLSTNTITFAVAPVSTDVILADYRK